jgi:hypothetical protein
LPDAVHARVVRRHGRERDRVAGARRDAANQSRDGLAVADVDVARERVAVRPRDEVVDRVDVDLIC